MSVPKLKNLTDGRLVIEHDYEGVRDRLSALAVEEQGDLWRHISEVVERLAPGISPFDKREAVAEILRPVRQVFIDAFW